MHGMRLDGVCIIFFFFCRLLCVAPLRQAAKLYGTKMVSQWSIVIKLPGTTDEIEMGGTRRPRSGDKTHDARPGSTVGQAVVHWCIGLDAKWKAIIDGERPERSRQIASPVIRYNHIR